MRQFSAASEHFSPQGGRAGLSPRKAGRAGMGLVVGGMILVTVTGCFGGTVRSPMTARSPTKSPRHQISPGREESGISVAAVGDTMLGDYPELPPGPNSYLDAVKQNLKADEVFGNLEGTLTELEESPKCPEGDGGDCYAFRTPPDYARYLRSAGFTAMNDANNHSFDFGEAGEVHTVESLHQAGIAQSGLPGEITLLPTHGIEIAFLGFAPYSNTASLLDLPSARSLIEKAAEESAIVVVAIHAGAEGVEAQHVSEEEEFYLGEDRGDAEEFAHMAVDAGADLVLGSGPHVLRAMEVYKKRLIAYSLGNFSGFHNFETEGALGDSVILHVNLAPDGSFRSGGLASIRRVEEGRPVPDPEDTGAKLVASLSQEDLGSTGIHLGPEDRIHAP